MPYCRKCGAKLEEDAKYCYKCGTPTNFYPQDTIHATSSAPLRQSRLFTLIIIIIVAAVTIFIIAAVASAPLNPVNFNQTNEIISPGANKLNLTFWTDVGEVNIFTNSTSSAIIMDTSVTGKTSIFNSNQPVTIDVQNSTSNGNINVNARVSNQRFTFSGNTHTVVNIYVNPKLNLALNVHSNAGIVTLNSNSETKIQSLDLHTNAGNVVLNLDKGSTVNGQITLRSGAGNVDFNMDQAEVNGNITVTLETGVGSLNMNITETKKMNGNMQINAHTGTGQIDLDRMLIDGDVGSRITSDVGLGQINSNVNNFTGDKSSLESNNYPAVSNIDVHLDSGLGNININATYQTDILATMRN